jgi:MFS family permease
LAPSLTVLETNRASQGAGAALLLTSSMANVSYDYDGAEWAKAFAIWGASIGIALAVGPIAGGIITQFFGWRPIFLINVPICHGLLYATWRNIRESRRPEAQNIDVPGLVSSSLALALLVHVLISGVDPGWLHPLLFVQLAGAAVFHAAFVWRERRNAQAMIDVRLFRSQAFVGALLTMTGYDATIQVLIFLLPLYLQTVSSTRVPRLRLRLCSNPGMHSSPKHLHHARIQSRTTGMAHTTGVDFLSVRDVMQCEP